VHISIIIYIHIRTTRICIYIGFRRTYNIIRGKICFGGYAVCDFQRPRGDWYSSEIISDYILYWRGRRRSERCRYTHIIIRTLTGRRRTNKWADNLYTYCLIYIYIYIYACDIIRVCMYRYVSDGPRVIRRTGVCASKIYNMRCPGGSKQVGGGVIIFFILFFFSSDTQIIRIRDIGYMWIFSLSLFIQTKI